MWNETGIYHVKFKQVFVVFTLEIYMYNSVQTAGKPKKAFMIASELITWDFLLKFFIICFGEKHM